MNIIILKKIIAVLDFKITWYGHLLISVIRRFILNLRPTIKIGKGCLIDSGVMFKTILCRTNITFGKNCYILKGSKFITNVSGYIQVGDNTSINYDVIIYGHGGVKIGNGVRIAAGASIISFNHGYSQNIEIYKQALVCKGICIEDDVWIGNGAKILDGITIAKGCVIGAGSVVTKSTEPYCIYAGVPAKFIKYR